MPRIQIINKGKYTAEFAAGLPRKVKNKYHPKNRWQPIQKT